MTAKATYLPYRDTGYFPDLVLDYLDRSDSVKPFFEFPPDMAGISEAIHHRKEFPVNRELLIAHLICQYESVHPNQNIVSQIASLKEANTFTVTTAHQPNLFTGPLYFIYKIIHAIKLSIELKQQFPDLHFVPVYYMGNEDADFEELGHCRVMGERYAWETKQKGAFGKMLVDDGLEVLLRQLESMLPVYPYGDEIVTLLRTSFAKGRRIEEATFRLVHSLFEKWGLLVLIADSKELKAQFSNVVKDELINQNSKQIVQKTIENLKSKYPIQTGTRDINLFYLKDGQRERIEKEGVEWKVVNTSIRFNHDELLDELEIYPERFSPNVILRPLYQEMILPNVVFVGGAGELSYWLELKDLFQFYHQPFPVLLLRKSLLLINEDDENKIKKLGFEVKDFFQPSANLLNQYVRKHSLVQTDIDAELTQLKNLYNDLSIKASKTDNSLSNHVHALHRDAEKKLEVLLKKMERAQRRRFSDEQRRIEKLRQELFPGGSLQERAESIWTFFAMRGGYILDELLQHTEAFKQEWKTLILS